MRRVHALLFALLAVAPVLGAEAASFDCAAAASPVEHRICDDPALSAADSALGAAFADALAAGPHPQGLRTEQRGWVAETRDKAATNDAMLAAYRSRTDELRADITQWNAIRAEIAATPLGGACLKLMDAGSWTCAVTEKGALADAPGGPLRYQVQTYKDGDSTPAIGVVVVAGEGSAARAVTWGAEEGTMYDTPKIVKTPQGPVLDVPGYLSGTGNYSAESLFVPRDGTWREVDIEYWLRQLNTRLPSGREVWKGVYPDWVKMTADTPLWKSNDGNCCPTGGSAAATLRLNGERIELVSVRVSTKPIQ